MKIFDLVPLNSQQAIKTVYYSMAISGFITMHYIFWPLFGFVPALGLALLLVIVCDVIAAVLLRKMSFTKQAYDTVVDGIVSVVPQNRQLGAGDKSNDGQGYLLRIPKKRKLLK